MAWKRVDVSPGRLSRDQRAPRACPRCREAAAPGQQTTGSLRWAVNRRVVAFAPFPCLKDFPVVQQFWV